MTIISLNSCLKHDGGYKKSAGVDSGVQQRKTCRCKGRKGYRVRKIHAVLKEARGRLGVLEGVSRVHDGASMGRMGSSCLGVQGRARVG